MIVLTTHGRPVGFERPVVGRVALASEQDAARRSSAVIVTENAAEWGDIGQYRAFVTTMPLGALSADMRANPIPIVHHTRAIDHLRSGDVIALMPRSGLIRTIFRPDSAHNALFATERCNSFCLMCSQPPVDRNDSEQLRINIEAIRLMDPSPMYLTITGGEPTLLCDGLFRMLSELKDRLPETQVHLLTNARRFAWPDFTEAFMEVGHPRLSLGVPLYSDHAPDHDYVVQAHGAFDQTMQGLYRLARYDQPIEVRVVLHKLTVPRLRDLAYFIYRNLPFVYHVALMGLEITGFTRPNLSKLWVDPYDYTHELQETVELLAIRGMNVSIYNHPLCLLPEGLWKFARRSISDWKNIYLGVCQQCGVREQCGGFFKSAERQHSEHLHPLASELNLTSTS